MNKLYFDVQYFNINQLCMIKIETTDYEDLFNILKNSKIQLNQVLLITRKGV